MAIITYLTHLYPAAFSKFNIAWAPYQLRVGGKRPGLNKNEFRFSDSCFCN